MSGQHVLTFYNLFSPKAAGSEGGEHKIQRLQGVCPWSLGGTGGPGTKTGGTG